MQYHQAWLCPQAPLVRDTGIRVGQGGFHAVGELIGQSGWYAFERINTDDRPNFENGQHNNYIFPKQQLEAYLKRLGVYYPTNIVRRLRPCYY